MRSKNFSKLAIILLNKNINISVNCTKYILIGPGTIKNINGNRIYLSDLQKKNSSKLKAELVYSLQKELRKEKLDSFFEFEISNLRNDKTKFIDCILNFLLIREIIKKNEYQTIELITDNKYSINVFNKLKIKNLIVRNFSKRFHENFLFIPFCKFLIKSFFVVFTLTFFKEKRKFKQNIALSIFPNFHKDKKENFFNNKDFLKLNFLLTDETHLNHTTLDILKIIYNSKNLNLIHIEQYIKFTHLIICFFNFLNGYRKIKKKKRSLIINDLDFSIFYDDYLKSSFLNRAKLEIYNGAIKKFLTIYKPLYFHLYMFEYSFGFYLINQIKKNFKNIKIYGYQHGIFSDKLLWLDIIKKSNLIQKYSPTKLYCLNYECLKAYKKKYSFFVSKYTINKKLNLEKSKNFNLILKKKGNKNIFFSGTHDVNELIVYLNNKPKKEKKNYFIKLHPKTKLTNELHELKVLKDTKKIKFKNIYLSPTSTMVYELLKKKVKFKVFKIDYKWDILNSNSIKKNNISII
ncbi:hypothetical protein OA094_01605 [Candidatus Pelagibacter sp.]|nr:hypothetical protein [Candidatus Pelagibacter sp.]